MMSDTETTSFEKPIYLGSAQTCEQCGWSGFQPEMDESFDGWHCGGDGCRNRLLGKGRLLYA